MNRINLKHIALGASLLIAGAAQAQQTIESYPFNLDTPVKVQTSRAQVLDELRAARAAGELVDSKGYPHKLIKPHLDTGPTLARQTVVTIDGQVVAESAKALKQIDQSLYAGA